MCTNEGKCDCGFDGWRGETCDRRGCPGYDISCTGHGMCNPTTRACTCDPGWSGEGCHIAKCQDDCNLHGTCLPLDQPVCNCTGLYFGLTCAQQCVHGTVKTPDTDDLSTQFCECDPCYTGPECNLLCGGHGQCVNGSCDCGSLGWRGDVCEKAGCPGQNGLDCTGHGSCIVSQAGQIG